MFQNLCGGVHILEFLTQEPDLYASLLPEEWRIFFDLHDVSDILDLLMNVSLDSIAIPESPSSPGYGLPRWRSACAPPLSLREYINDIRQHSLDRAVNVLPQASSATPEFILARTVAVGMKPKKIHEVARLARYVDHLSSELSSSQDCQISHLVDFGSGQNYLGRALVCPPYNRRVIALESKPLNIDGARSMDVTAKLAKKEVIMRDKKRFRSQVNCDQQPPGVSHILQDDAQPYPPSLRSHTTTQPEHEAQDPDTNIHYIETIIQDGDLSSILSHLPQHSDPLSTQNLMVISLHSCGNLLHHGLRSLTLNPSVRATALVGCCYNLLTERLPPPPHPHPSLRSTHPRLQRTSSACDPHGFPMSLRFTTYPHKHGPGIRFNITARMMAVQAPQNWTAKDCDNFFTRHFYRALFQRILVDRGVVVGPQQHLYDTESETMPGETRGESQPIILGSLRKQCYTSFTAYVRAAITKLKQDPVHASKITSSMEPLTDDEILQYERNYRHKKKELSIVWSLMAFSAGVVESAIVVDRWQWLREQEEVTECWVESIFEYGISPRNLVVVGVKRGKE
ncbi:MAG: hypothetical protein Q9208_006738 [Pyrenodesmia sp. 3 TL-2023]